MGQSSVLYCRDMKPIIGIFELQEGKFVFEDSDGKKRMGNQMLVNKSAICRGQFFINET
jgi:hypothetical protein